MRKLISCRIEIPHQNDVNKNDSVLIKSSIENDAKRDLSKQSVALWWHHKLWFPFVSLFLFKSQFFWTKKSMINFELTQENA